MAGWGVKTTRLALLVAVGLLLSWIEQLLLPPIGIPGIKLGLANLATLMTLYLFSGRDAFMVSVARVLLSGYLFGSLASLAYAMSGALVSLAGMCLLRRIRQLSIIGVSGAGGCLHNMGQLAVASVVVGEMGLVAYLAPLIIAGTVTGCVVGWVAQMILKRFGQQA